MFNKNIKLVLFIACFVYAVYQFIETFIGNGIMFILIGLTFLFLYYKNEFILLAFLKLRKQDFVGTEAWLSKIKNPQSALGKSTRRFLPSKSIEAIPKILKLSIIQSCS